MFRRLASISVAASHLSIDGTHHLSTLIDRHQTFQTPSISVHLRRLASVRFLLGIGNPVTYIHLPPVETAVVDAELVHLDSKVIRSRPSQSEVW